MILLASEKERSARRSDALEGFMSLVNCFGGACSKSFFRGTLFRVVTNLRPYGKPVCVSVSLLRLLLERSSCGSYVCSKIPQFVTGKGVPQALQIQSG
jgi:hypothetical protein